MEQLTRWTSLGSPCPRSRAPAATGTGVIDPGETIGRAERAGKAITVDIMVGIATISGHTKPSGLSHRLPFQHHLEMGINHI